MIEAAEKFVAGMAEPFRKFLILLLLITGAALPGAAQSPAADPGAKLVKEIRIGKLRYTREETIRRELISKVGEPYSDENLTEDRMRLDRLRIFSSITIDVSKEPDGVVLDLELREIFPFIPIASVEASDENGLSIGPGFRAINLLGRNVSFRAAARFGGANTVETVLENPWFAGNHLSYKLEYYYRNRQNQLDNFKENSHEANFRLGSYLGQQGRIGGRFGLISLKSDTPGITLAGNNRDNVPSLGFFLGQDTRDYWTNPQKGWWNEFDVSKSGGFLGGPAGFWSFIFDIRRYQPIADRHTLALFTLTTLRTGRVGKEIPIHQDFHLGGTNTIRGWSLNSSIGKNQLINTAEYRYTLMKPRAVGFKGFNVYVGMELAAFGDLGIAWSGKSDFKADNFIGGYGFGLRLLVPFVDVIRIDFALGEPGKGLRSHFGLLEKAVKQRERVR